MESDKNVYPYNPSFIKFKRKRERERERERDRERERECHKLP